MEKQCQDFYLLKWKTNVWCQLRHGGNKYRTISASIIIPPITFKKFIGQHKNKAFGHNHHQLRMEKKWNVDTTATPNGQCPYAFVKYLFNDGYTLETSNIKSQGIREKVNIFNSNIYYSERTNILKYTANVTWSTDDGQTWQKLHDTN